MHLKKFGKSPCFHIQPCHGSTYKSCHTQTCRTEEHPNIWGQSQTCQQNITYQSQEFLQPATFSKSLSKNTEAQLFPHLQSRNLQNQVVKAWPWYLRFQVSGIFSIDTIELCDLHTKREGGYSWGADSTEGTWWPWLPSHEARTHEKDLKSNSLSERHRSWLDLRTNMTSENRNTRKGTNGDFTPINKNMNNDGPVKKEQTRNGSVMSIKQIQYSLFQPRNQSKCWFQKRHALQQQSFDTWMPKNAKSLREKKRRLEVGKTQKWQTTLLRLTQDWQVGPATQNHDLLPFWRMGRAVQWQMTVFQTHVTIGLRCS